MTYTFTERKTERTEGFWSSTNVPVGNPEPWEGMHEFLTNLSKTERRAGATQYRGWSNCRLCGCHNGSATYHKNGWDWPSGFRHYVEEHNLKPSDDFIRMVFVSAS